jgi:hypothetical protein
MNHIFRLALRAGIILLCFAVEAVVRPLHACGCGVYIPRESDGGGVQQERALVRWDGRTEDIVMELDVTGSTSAAAWILPVPGQAEVRLANNALFHDLFELTKPRIETVRRHAIPSFGAGSDYDGVTAGSRAVTLLQRLALGPLDVSMLAASDAMALTGWLEENGYTFPEGMADVLAPYVEQAWYYVAVRLQPAATGDALAGSLDPLWVTFAADELVYPMRATALSTTALPVTLYILAPHRTQKTVSFGRSYISFADWLDPADGTTPESLRPWVTERMFLTKFEEVIEPQQVDDDFRFTLAARDAVHHDVITNYEDDYTLFYAGACGVPLLSGLLLLASLLHYLRRHRRTAAQTT